MHIADAAEAFFHEALHYAPENLPFETWLTPAHLVPPSEKRSTVSVSPRFTSGMSLNRKFAVLVVPAFLK